MQYRRWGVGIALGVMLHIAGAVVPVAAYEEVVVAGGGSLAGTIALEGKLPVPKGYNLTTLPDPVYCGRISDGKGWRLLQPFQVGPEGAFRDVVVFIEEVERGKPFRATVPRIEALDCLFKPFTMVVRDRNPVQIVNMDPVMHDIQAYETSHLGPRVLFNLPLPMNPLHPKELSEAAQYHKHLAGQPVMQDVHMTKGRRVFVMQCGFHAYMESWGMTVENPYYALTDADGRFEIGDIPPGTYKVSVWHPTIGGAKEFTVTIKAGEKETLNVTVPVPTGRLYANQMIENPYVRFAVTDDVQSHIKPTLELQKP